MPRAATGPRSVGPRAGQQILEKAACQNMGRMPSVSQDKVAWLVESAEQMAKLDDLITCLRGFRSQPAPATVQSVKGET